MAKHVMALTYKPKIEAVKNGTCGQTVRLLHKGPDPLPQDITKRLKRPGDEILMHTWEGKPYKSKWGWQGRLVLSEVLEIYYMDGWRWSIFDEGHGSHCYPLNRYELLDIVKRDHIDPPTIEEWERTLMRLNGMDSLEDTDWEVIRWPRKAQTIAYLASDGTIYQLPTKEPERRIEDYFELRVVD